MNIYEYIEKEINEYIRRKEINMNIYEHEVGLTVNPAIKEFLNCNVNVTFVKLSDPDKTIMTLNDWVVEDVTETSVSLIYHDNNVYHGNHDNDVYCICINTANLSPNNDVIVSITKCDGSTTPVEVFTTKAIENIIVSTRIQPFTWGKLCVKHDNIYSDIKTGTFYIVIEERTDQSIKFKYHDRGYDGKLRRLTGVIQLVNYHNAMKWEFIADERVYNSKYFVDLSDITFQMM